MPAAQHGPSAVRRSLLVLLILVVQFALIEGGLRLHGAAEGSTTFQSLFLDDPAVGHRLRPGASIRYTTVEFTTDINVNAQGVRDDEPIGPKEIRERRVIVLGDSLVLSVQVPFAETFCEQLERRLTAMGGPLRWRVINGGVQGYGPVQAWRFFDAYGAAFEPDIVLIVPFVGNDATEAADLAAALAPGPLTDPARPDTGRLVRRIVRSSVTLQSVRVRWDQLRSRFLTGTPERPVAAYLQDPPPQIDAGLDASRRAFGLIAERARGIGATPAIALMPARFQTDDADYGRFVEIVRATGAVLVRNAASERFTRALAPLNVPMMDLQPILAAQPDRTGLFFQRNVHLTPRGHEVVGRALFDFLQSSGAIERAAAPRLSR